MFVCSACQKEIWQPPFPYYAPERLCERCFQDYEPILTHQLEELSHEEEDCLPEASPTPFLIVTTVLLTVLYVLHAVLVE